MSDCPLLYRWGVVELGIMSEDLTVEMARHQAKEGKRVYMLSIFYVYEFQ